MYKGDAGIGYESGDLEVPGKAIEYLQKKNKDIRNYLGSLKEDYASIMQMPSRNSAMHSRIENKVQDMYDTNQKPKPILEREEQDTYLRDVA